jgi:hypothetical protein
VKHIDVQYQDNTYDIIPDLMLDKLISFLQIKKFYRCSEQRWVTVSSDRIRGTGGSYIGPERRIGEIFPERKMIYAHRYKV